MAIAVIMPRQGQSVESCIITKWHKKEGDPVKTGDLLFTYETDKATFDEEAKNDGYLLKILRQEEEDVPCLENVCIIGETGEDISAFLTEDAKPQIQPEKEAEAPPVIQQIQPVTIKPQTDDGIIKISPRAKNLAQKLGLDYTAALPTGAEGRIIERDIERVAEKGVIALRHTQDKEVTAAISSEDAAAFVEEKITNMRKVISKAMLNSLQTTAQLTHTSSFDASDIMSFRNKIKPLVEKGEIENITLNDIVMYAVSRVLPKFKVFNAHMLGDTMRYFKNVNLAMAVDTERGLMVPVCFAAQTKSLSALARELKKLASDCQKGTISPDNLKNGSFTVSNLGIFGTESFTPVLNAPQTGILGVNNITTRLKGEKENYRPYPCMALSFTYDHRAADGVTAAKFLQAVCLYLESFSVNIALESL